MSGYHKTFELQLDAADDNGIAETQSLGGAGALTLDGDLVSGGVATLDVARRILITSAANDSGITFTVTGTDRYGRAISEVLSGGDTTSVYTEMDFLTVTGVTGSGATAGNVIVGTNGVGTTAPLVVDRFVNPADYSYSTEEDGEVEAMIEVSFDDLSPAWAITEDVVWKDWDWKDMGIIAGPVTMIRLKNNSGTGTSRLKVITPLKAGRV